MTNFATKTRMRAGFTLVELLVVISIIALLLGILLPSLGSARESARAVVCSTQLRQIAIAGQTFSSENKGELVGSPATSGQELINHAPANSEGSDINDTPGVAVQPWDWAGPLAWGYMSAADNRPPTRRDERFMLLSGAGLTSDSRSGSGAMAVFACPSNDQLSQPFDAGGAHSSQIAGTAFRPTLSMSYSSPRDFLWGSGPQATTYRPTWAREGFWGNEAGTLWQTTAISGSVLLPGGNKGTAYSPRLDRAGDIISKKIAFAEGNRFWVSDGPLDHDVSSRGAYGGAFSDVGAWSRFSRAWPVGRSKGSFRHGGRNGPAFGNLAFLDGHVDRLQIDAARKPEFWLPSGSQVRVADIWIGIRDEYEALSRGPLSQFGQGRVTMW